MYDVPEDTALPMAAHEHEEHRGIAKASAMHIEVQSSRLRAFVKVDDVLVCDLSIARPVTCSDC